jgi:hypothetical protein
MTRVPDSTPLRWNAKAWRRSASALVMLIALSLGAGCTTIAIDLASAGEDLTGPFPHDYREIVQRWIDSDFYDLSTITSLRVSTPTAGHSNRWPKKARIYGWYAKVNFKARDSVGASKGKLAYSVLIREGEVVSSRKLLY